MVCLHSEEFVRCFHKGSQHSEGLIFTHPERKYIHYSLQVQDCFHSAISKPVESSSFVGTLVFSQAPASRVGCLVWQSWEAGNPTGTSKPRSTSGGLGGEAGYADGSFLTKGQHPGMSAVLCRAAQDCLGVDTWLAGRGNLDTLVKSRQAVMESLSVYTLLAA